MANTRCQNECEAWVRDQWLPREFGHVFRERNVPLSSGGQFKFDAVSEDGSIVVSISTSRTMTSGGKRGAGKLAKLRGDMLFHTLALPARHVMVLTEPCMHDACLAEKARGRVPGHLEFRRAVLPSELAEKLAASRDRSSIEVRPSSPDATD